MAANIYDLIAQNKGMTMTPWGPMSPDVSYKQYTPEEANKTFDIIRDLPEFQAQQAGVDELSGELDRLKKLPQVSGDTWVKPLLALADSETGSKLSQGYDENDLSQKRNEMIMKYQDSLLNRKKQQADTLMSGLGKFKSGTTTTKDTGISPSEQAKLDFQKAKQQQDYELELQKLAAQKAKGKGSAKPTWTPLEKKMDEKFAETALNWSAGGKQSAEDAKTDLKKVIGWVKEGSLKVGPVDTAFGLAGMLPTKLREARKIVDTSVLPKLRATFGAQFTQKEGELLRDLNLDTSGSEEQLLKALTNLYNFTDANSKDLDEKFKYFQGEGKGSLKGFTGKPTVVSDGISENTQKASGAKKKTSEIEW